MKVIDDELLDEVTTKAGLSDRLRMNYNLHENLDDKAQRLLNALNPVQYFQFTVTFILRRPI